MHGVKNDDRQCKVCGDECETIVHEVWMCPTLEMRIRQSVGKGGGGSEFSP